MNQYIKTVRNLISRNSSDLLLVGGVGCLLGGGALAIRQTPKAMKILEEKKEKDNLTKVKAVAPLFVPAIGFTVLGITQIVCSRNITKNKIAAITTAYTVSETAYKTYKDKVREYVDPETSDVIDEQVAAETLRRDPLGNKEVIMTYKGDVLMYDEMSGRYFKSTINDVDRAVNTINKRLRNDMEIMLNEFYTEIGLDAVKIGCEMGWSIEKEELKMAYGSHIADNGEPCIVLQYDVNHVNW